MSKLDRRTSERVIAATERYALSGHGDIKSLQGSEEYRLRVGDWRVRFVFAHAKGQIVILRVRHRREVYR